MIDKIKTIESFLETLDEMTAENPKDPVFEVHLRNGARIKCPIHLPHPAAEIALRIIKNEEED